MDFFCIWIICLWFWSVFAFFAVFLYPTFCYNFSIPLQWTAIVTPTAYQILIVPITNVMSDQYCYRTSKKIRQVFDMKRRNGEFIGSYAPYGYVKDPKDRHALLVDPETAEVVKSIFSMFLFQCSSPAWISEGLPTIWTTTGHFVPQLINNSKGSNIMPPMPKAILCGALCGGYGTRPPAR